MKRSICWSVLLLLAVGGVCVAQAPNTFTATFQAAQPAGKEIELFNGKDLDNWGFFLKDPNAKKEDVWSVQDGTIVCKGKPPGYIFTDKEFTNYVLTLEWRWNPEAGGGNSGVLVRVVGPDKIWPKSVEAQLASKNAGDIWIIDMFPAKTAADRADPKQSRHTFKMKETNEKPLGEWNAYEITMDKGNLTLKVNGEVQNTATDVEVVPGRIALQSEGREVHFRNVKLKPLD